MKNKSIWRYNQITGYWNHVRTVLPENEQAYLKIFKDDEPKIKFKLSVNKPN